MNALKYHKTLSGIYRRADPRFIYRAADHAAHRGYQEWHRLVDRKVVDWIARNARATPQKFVQYLNELYQEPWVSEHIPNVFIDL